MLPFLAKQQSRTFVYFSNSLAFHYVNIIKTKVLLLQAKVTLAAFGYSD
jgi:hypothetical protein